MNNPSSEKPTARSGQHPGAHESPESLETFSSRTKRPGKVGLANETRPGLGTRARENPKTGRPEATPEERAASVEGDVPHPPEARPEPSEQDSDSLAQEQQRDTGVSGHTGGT
jgi:hypothetical protein